MMKLDLYRLSNIATTILLSNALWVAVNFDSYVKEWDKIQNGCLELRYFPLILAYFLMVMGAYIMTSPDWFPNPKAHNVAILFLVGYGTWKRRF